MTDSVLGKKSSLNSVKFVNKTINANTRKAKKIEKSLKRTQRMAKKKVTQRTAKDPIVARYLWFKFAADPSRDILTKGEMAALIKAYIARNDEEIEELRSNRRIGRPKDPKEDLLVMLKQKDEAEFETGFVLPDFTDGKNVKFLKTWEGDPNALPMLKTTIIKI